MNVAVLGAGAWGTALAKVLHENGNAVTLWDINAATLEQLRLGQNERYLPGVRLPTDWRVEADFGKAIGGRECLVMAIPSQSFRPVAAKLKGIPPFCSASPKASNLKQARPLAGSCASRLPRIASRRLRGPASPARWRWGSRRRWCAPAKTIPPPAQSRDFFIGPNSGFTAARTSSAWNTGAP